MKTQTQRKITIGMMVLTTLLFATSCKKETAEPASLPRPTVVHGPDQLLNVTYGGCIPGHGMMCLYGGFGCLLRFPPDPMFPEGDQTITYYAPIANGQGETGVQMMVVFATEFPGLNDGILGREQEGDIDVIPVHPEIASALNCQSIQVINKVYFPVYDDQHPFGYVYFDCAVQH